MIVVSGVNGFVGRHLVRELVAAGSSVLGVGRESGPDPEIADLLADYVEADLAAGEVTLPSVDAVIHLAGLSAVAPSFDRPIDYLSANAAMLVNLCEPLARAKSAAKVLVVSSGAVYATAQPLPINEAGTTNATSPYVVSKLAVEQFAQYYANRGLHTVVARPFNHIGPGQARGFILPDLIAKVREAQLAGTPLQVGNLTTRRDYTDVRDVVGAYRRLLDADTAPGEIFNVCSGVEAPGTDILAGVVALLDAPDLDVRVDPALVRPTDPAVMQGDSSRLRARTGWAPSYSLQQTIGDTIENERCAR